MNLSLLKPKEMVSVFPDVLENIIRLGDTLMGNCIEFNKRGTFMALGCNDGRIIIFDFQTHSISKQLIGPYNAFVTTVNWFNNGRYLLVAYYAVCVCIWDIAEDKIIKTYDYPVWRCEVNKMDEKYIILSLTKGQPILMNRDTLRSVVLQIPPFQHKTKKRVDYNFACFDHSGNYVYVGNSIGQIAVFRTVDQKLVALFHVCSDFAAISDDPKDIQSNIQSIDDLPAKFKKGDYGIKYITFSEQGKNMLVNCETSIRLFQEATDVITEKQKYRKTVLTFQKEFRDLVNNQPFTTCAFSGWNSLQLDSEYVIGTNGNDIYIWDRMAGELVKLLEGPKENILCAVWHPLRPLIVSSTNAGCTYVWTKQITENWSSFAKEFLEIDDNEMYVEKGDDAEETVTGIDDSFPSQAEAEAFVDITGLTDEQKENEKEYIIPTAPVRDREMLKYLNQLNTKDHKKPKRKRKPAKKTNKTKRKPQKKRKRKVEDSDSDSYSE